MAAPTLASVPETHPESASEGEHALHPATCGAAWPQVQADLASIARRERTAGGAGVAHWDRYCDAVLQSEHFRFHFSTRPGTLPLPAPGWHVAAEGHLGVVACGSAGIVIVDFEEPTSPRELARLATPGEARQALVRDGLAYIACADAGLLVVDLTNPTRPDIVGIIDTDASLERIQPDPAAPGEAEGNEGGAWALLGTTSSGILQILFETPRTPRLGMTLTVAEVAGCAATAGHLYVAAGARILVYERPPHAPPVLGGTVELGEQARDLAIASNELAVTMGSYGLAAFDLAEPLVPRPIVTGDTGSADRIAVSGSTFFWTTPGGLGRYTVGSPWLSLQTTSFPGTPYPGAFVGDFFMVASQEEDLRVVRIDSDDLHVSRDQISGWPDSTYAKAIVETLEHSYRVFMDRLGMREPVRDLDDLRRIDVYMFDLPYSNAAGVAAPLAYFDAECGTAALGFIGLDVHYLPATESSSETVAHEVFHCFQYAYDEAYGDFVIESTAVWAARVAVPSSPRLRSVRDWFRAPHVRLFAGGNWPYGSAHFWDFLSERHDDRFVTALFERGCEDRDQIGALSNEIESRGSTLADEFVEFTVWNATTGSRHDGAHYPADDLPEIRVEAEHTGLPVVGGRVPTERLAQPAGSNYVRFVGPGLQDSLLVEVAGASTMRDRTVSFLATRHRTQHVVWTLAPDGDGRVHFTLPQWPSYDELTMIVATHPEASWDSLGYTYSARESGPSVADGLVRIAPLPFRDRASFSVRVATHPVAVRLEIYDPQGRRVRLLDQGTLPRGIHSIHWDGNSANGTPSPSGMYLYRLRVGSEVARGRLVRIR